jgi:hypothetical protein
MAPRRPSRSSSSCRPGAGACRRSGLVAGVRLVESPSFGRRLVRRSGDGRASVTGRREAGALSGFRSSAGFHLEMFDARTAHDDTVIATYFKATASFTGPCGSRGFAVTNERTAFEGVVRREIPGDRIARDQIFHNMAGISSLIALHGSARHAWRETGRRNAAASDPGGHAKREERI